MWYVALTLGLFGSLHCLGMCGPLAIAFCNKKDQTSSENVKSAIAYNLGRTVTYTLLGLIIGLVGQLIFIADIQQYISIIIGVFLIASFILSIDINRFFNSNSIIQRYYFSVKSLISKMMSKSLSYHPFQLGMANGLLPCGLVYLALGGALVSGNAFGGALFMTLFGLGTLPMLFALTTGIGFVSPNVKIKLRSILPFVTLGFGLFLIYRGIVVDVPKELNFWEALQNPIMCH